MSLPRFRCHFTPALLLIALCLPSASIHAQETPFAYGKAYKNWLNEDVRWIITDEERVDFKKLSDDKQRDQFIEAFWERRNPTPGAVENAFKEEHYRRLTYSNVHFAAGAPGYKTDRGHIFIVAGVPDKIDYYSYATDAQKPTKLVPESEVWHYGYIKDVGRNVSIRFVDSCRCGDYRMTQEQDDPLPKDFFGPPDY